MKNESLGMEDKIRSNKAIIQKISQTDSKIEKRKQLHKNKIIKHEKLMSKIRKKECLKYEISNDSSDMDEFIPKTQFLVPSSVSNDNYEEEEEVEYLR